MTVSQTEVVITGLGIVSPIGIGRDAFWRSLQQGTSGVGPIRSFDATGLPVSIAAEVSDFDPRKYVANRKSLKVMCRDAQLAVAASVLARRDAGLADGTASLA
ncbi:MAG: beta-ketoacyl-[acyl-carrier-protein] synthase II, partial [Candidatus Nealsonbacteria bacterium]|nr:beta-ketoacyl-[acyl-carrier-protein] synthase II [Candidatus Nealsonbacteria bacterium]